MSYGFVLRPRIEERMLKTWRISCERSTTTPGTSEKTERSDVYCFEERQVESCIVYDEDAFVVDHDA